MPSDLASIKLIEAEEIAALIKLEPIGSGYELDSTLALSQSLLLRMREAEVAALCKRLSRQAGQTGSANRFAVSVGTPNAVVIAYKLAKALAKINNRSLSATEVCEVLQISNLERIQWTKSGRLTASGKHEIGRGTSVKSDLYRARDIIAVTPEDVERWRRS